MLKYFLIITLLLGVFETRSQTIDVKYFRWLDNNGQREGMPKLDTVFNNCSVIKVITHQAGFTFDFATSGKVFTTIQKKNETWLWVPSSAKKINITNKEAGISCSYTFAKDLEANEVYAIDLVINKGKKIGNNQLFSKWFILDSQPINANLYIDDYPATQTPYYGSLSMGVHKIRMEYYGEKAEKKINVSNKNDFAITLYLKERDLPLVAIKNKGIDEPDKDPEFPGGFKAYLKFIKDNLKDTFKNRDYPGTVYVQMVISETGKTSDYKILRGLEAACNKEALRIVKLMPKWKAAYHSGYHYPTYYQIPVKFGYSTY